MGNFCPFCGKENVEGAIYCGGCGAKLDQSISTVIAQHDETDIPESFPESISDINEQTNSKKTVNTYTEFKQNTDSVQVYNGYTVQSADPMAPKKKSKTGLVIALIAIIVAVVVVVLVLLFLFGGNGGLLGGESSIYQGSWDVEMYSVSLGTITLQSDYSIDYDLYMTMKDVGTWSANNNQLTLTIDPTAYISVPGGTYDCEFSSDSNKITLKSSGIKIMTWTKT